MTETKNELKEVIDELVDARREYYRLAFDKEAPQKLGNPSTAAQISVLERKLGKALPPSYRAFLELHNGWSQFDGDGKLLAVEDHDSPWVKDCRESMSEQFAEFGGEDPFKVGGLPVMLGKSIHNYLVLDPRTVRANGEMDFVSYDLADKEETFQDFTSYLRDVLGITRTLIENEKEGENDKG